VATDEERLLVTLEARMAQFEKAMAKANADSDRTAKRIVANFKPAERYLAEFGRAALAGLGAYTGFEGLKKLAETFIDNTIEASKASAQLDAVLKSTGGTAGVTAEAAQALATELEGLTTYGDDAIVSAEALLLTFTRIGKDIFPQATATVLDMSTALGQDLKTSAIQLGKALNDPVLGVTALRKVGVNFSAAQVEVIKKLVATGQSAKAQTMILQELQTEFGGSAHAARETLGGALQALGEAWGNLFELEGPAAEGLRKSIEDLISVISDPDFHTAIQEMGSLLFEALSRAAEEAKIASDNIRGIPTAPGASSFDDIVRGAQAASLAVQEFFNPTATENSLQQELKQTQEAVAALKAEIDSGASGSPGVLAGQLDQLQQKAAALTQQLQAVREADAYAGFESQRSKALSDLPSGIPAPASKASGNSESSGGTSAATSYHRKSPQERFEDDIATIKARTEAVKAETAALGLNREAQEQVRVAQDLLEKARRDGIAITPDVVRQINAEAAAYAAAEEQYQRTAEAQQRVNDIEESFADLGANSIVGLSDKTKSWNDVLNDTIGLLEDIIKQLIKASLFNSAGTGLFQSIAGAFFGAADGMAFAGGGQPQRFASGGIVSRPTLFRFANGTGLMGEAGPEAIIPLTRMANGRLGVDASGRGGARPQQVDVRVETVPNPLFSTVVETRINSKLASYDRALPRRLAERQARDS
jgi:hypothetical protein